MEDAVKMMRFVLVNDIAVGRTFNLASGVPTSINQLAYMVIELFGAVGVKPQHRGARNGDVMHSYADIEEAEDILGFEPMFDIKFGLKKIYERIIEKWEKIEVIAGI